MINGTELIEVIHKGVKEQNELPSILLGIIVALLTILISVAVAIFSEKKDFESLDRNVILDHVVKSRRLFAYLILSFAPLVLWNFVQPLFKIILLIFWLIGLYYIAKILSNSYNWMKGDKYNLRFDYLNKIENKNDMEESWRSVWQTENINFQNEHRFIEIFNESLNKMIYDSKNIENASKLIEDFYNYIDKRNTFLLTKDDLFLIYILTWHLEIWKNSQLFLKEKNINKFSKYNKTLWTLDSIFKKIEEYSLKEGNSFLFFEALKKHVDHHYNEYIYNKYYLKSLLDSFYDVLFRQTHNIEARLEVWDYEFPASWKITKKNLEDKENIVSDITLDNFFRFAIDRIREPSGKHDFALNEILRNLFPEVDPIIWARILLFIFTTYSNDRVRSVIERPWNIDFIGHVRVYSPEDEDIEDIYQHEEEKAYELATLLFPDELSTSKIESHLKELKDINYPENSPEERKRKSLSEIFQNLLIYSQN